MSSEVKGHRKAVIDVKKCVACGCCVKSCPRNAIRVNHGVMAIISQTLCMGCGICQKSCPASIIKMEVVE